MSDYLWGFLIGAIVGAVIMWLNMRSKESENPKPARSADECIDRLRLRNERLCEALEVVKRMVLAEDGTPPILVLARIHQVAKNALKDGEE